MIDNAATFLLLRLLLGVSLFGHGLVRLPKLVAFADGMIRTFEKTPLPRFLVSPFAHALPVVEFSVGLLLILGLGTRYALAAAGAVMLSLIFGCCLLEQWDAIPSQLLHGAIAAVLLPALSHNTWSLDRIIAGYRRRT